ncbi:MAG: radical SAM protein [Bacteroidales bacterium]|jgi:uncharacterized protein|nr:radical SAM protein [Bacteroidales bacterium]
MKYKLSKYLYTQHNDDIVVIYNLLNNFIFALSQEKYLRLQNPDLCELKESYPVLFSAMEKLSVIVPDDFDEINQVKLMNRKTVFDTRQYRLTINSTLECNFHCWYCYEEHPKGRMTEDTMQAISNHIKLKIEEKSIQCLHLDWFGGEPFMYFDEIVFPLSKYLKQLVEENNIVFSNMATTNGYLLNEKRIKQLSEIGLTQFQITLDGNEEMHNKIRHDKQKNSFRTIIENINLLSEYPDNIITVRINYTDKTLSGINDIMDFFSENAKNRISVMFQQVWQDAFKKYLSCESNKKEFEKNGFKVHKHHLNKGRVCYADVLQQAVINFDGRVFKCTARDFNKTKEDGLLLPDGEIQWNMPMLAKRMGCATFENEHCLACKLVPVCLGPCSQKMMEFTKGQDFQPICLEGGIKAILDENIKIFHNNIKKEKII